jgi:hypothetical protein
MNDRNDEAGPDRRGPPAKARNADRFERQARALRENLRRRNAQRRAGDDPATDDPATDDSAS